MKNSLAIFCLLLLGFISCNKTEIKTVPETNDSVLKNDSLVISPMAHVMDSATSSGQTFSAIKNKKINLKDDAITLKSVNELTAQNAYLILSDDQSEAEVFLPNAKDGLVLKHDEEEGTAKWINDDYQLIKADNYSLMTTAKDAKPLFSSDSL